MSKNAKDLRLEILEKTRELYKIEHEEKQTKDKSEEIELSSESDEVEDD